MSAGWKKAKKLVAASSATQRLSQMMPNLDDSKAHWVAFAVELELPMGLGFDRDHRVSEIQEQGSAHQSGQVQRGDWLTHFDGVDLRQSGKSIVDVIDRSRTKHHLVFQRMMLRSRHRDGYTTFTVRLVPINGTMGIGLDKNHSVTAVYKGQPADRDGRLQVGDTLLAMDESRIGRHEHLEAPCRVSNEWGLSVYMRKAMPETDMGTGSL